MFLLLRICTRSLTHDRSCAHALLARRRALGPLARTPLAITLDPTLLRVDRGSTHARHALARLDLARAEHARDSSVSFARSLTARRRTRRPRARRPLRTRVRVAVLETTRRRRCCCCRSDCRGAAWCVTSRLTVRVVDDLSRVEYAVVGAIADTFAARFRTLKNNNF